jgi:hypothetical protein
MMNHDNDVNDFADFTPPTPYNIDSTPMFNGINNFTNSSIVNGGGGNQQKPLAILCNPALHPPSAQRLGWNNIKTAEFLERPMQLHRLSARMRDHIGNRIPTDTNLNTNNSNGSWNTQIKKESDRQWALYHEIRGACRTPTTPTLPTPTPTPPTPTPTLLTPQTMQSLSDPTVRGATGPTGSIQTDFNGAMGPSLANSQTGHTGPSGVSVTGPPDPNPVGRPTGWGWDRVFSPEQDNKTKTE